MSREQDSVVVPSDAQFRLQMGELTASELRTAKAAYRMAIAALTREAAPNGIRLDGLIARLQHYVDHLGDIQDGYAGGDPQTVKDALAALLSFRSTASEAAPQASGGELERIAVAFGDVQFQRGQAYALAANGGSQEAFTKSAVRGDKAQAELVAAIRRLATPDSAIQSQQGATGGAEWQHIANEWADAATNGLQWLRNVRDGVSLPEKGIAEMAENIARIRALAHPQAAGSAPVGVDAKDAARLDYMERESMTVQAVAWPTGGGDADVGWEAVTYHMDYPKLRVQGRGTTPREAIDAAQSLASTKERAE